jgi:hypothetical protein
MILVRIRLAIMMLVLSLTATLATGIWSYRMASSIAGLKGPAETMLFMILCATIAQLLVATAVVLQARRKQRELDAIADTVRYGGTLPSERLARMGALGERIHLILRDLAQASERKGERIAALTGLLRHAMGLVGDPVLIVGLDGCVVEASRGAREDARFKHLKTGKTRLEDLLPDIQLRSLLQTADSSHAAVELPGNITFYPVYSTRGDIGHFLVDFSRAGLREFLDGLRGPRTTVEAGKPDGGGLFRRLFRRGSGRVPAQPEKDLKNSG